MEFFSCYRNIIGRHCSGSKEVVPGSLVPSVLKLCHDNNAGTHVSLTCTLKELNYFLYGSYNCRKNYIASCQSCIQRRGFHNNVRAPVQSIPTTEYPVEQGGFHAVGLLVTSKHRNKWIIVILDYFTCYAEAYPVPDIRSHNAVKVSADFISRHGIMKSLYSDRCSNFLSHVIIEAYKN